MNDFSKINTDSILSKGFAGEDVFICISDFIDESGSFHEIVAKSRKQYVLTMRGDEKQAAIDFSSLDNDVTTWVYQSGEQLYYLYDRCESIAVINEEFEKYYKSVLRPKLDKIEFCHFGDSEEEACEEFYMQLDAQTLTVTIVGY